MFRDAHDMELADVEGNAERVRQAEEEEPAELTVKREVMAAEGAGRSRELRRIVKGL